MLRVAKGPEGKWKSQTMAAHPNFLKLTTTFSNMWATNASEGAPLALRRRVNRELPTRLCAWCGRDMNYMYVGTEAQSWGHPIDRLLLWSAIEGKRYPLALTTFTLVTLAASRPLDRHSMRRGSSASWRQFEICGSNNGLRLTCNREVNTVFTRPKFMEVFPSCFLLPSGTMSPAHQRNVKLGMMLSQKHCKKTQHA